MNYDFVGPAYTSKSREISWEECLNLYVETVESRGPKHKYVLLGTPGTLTTYPAFTDGGLPRCLYTSSTGVMYGVAGNIVYKFDSDESVYPATIGSIPGYSRCRMADDGRYLSIVDGANLYVHDMSDESSGLVTPIEITKPTHVAFLGGYTVINNTYLDPAVLFPPTTNLSYYSQLYNAMDWSSTNDPLALQFFAAEAKPDPIIAMERVGDIIWQWGPSSYECRGLSGNPNKPFARIGGSMNDIGCASKDSTAVIGDSAFWLGSTSHGGLSVYKSQGYDAIRISDYEVEKSISAVDFSDAIGWSYEESGHRFYVLTLRNANITWVWDDKEQAWHRRASRIAGTDQMTSWEPIYATSIGITTYIGSTYAPRILKLSSDAYTEWDGRLIKRIRSGPVIWSDMKTIRHNAFLLDMATGVGTVQPGSVGFDPKAMLRWSDDSGYTWSSEYWASFGLRGDYGMQVRFNRLGVARNRIYEVTITQPVKVVITGAGIDGGAGGRY